MWISCNVHGSRFCDVGIWEWLASKSVSAICAKNIGLFSIAGVMFWLVGYNLAYGIPEGGFIGKFIP